MTGFIICKGCLAIWEGDEIDDLGVCQGCQDATDFYGSRIGAEHAIAELARARVRRGTQAPTPRPGTPPPSDIAPLDDVDVEILMLLEESVKQFASDIGIDLGKGKYKRERHTVGKRLAALQLRGLAKNTEKSGRGAGWFRTAKGTAFLADGESTKVVRKR